MISQRLLNYLVVHSKGSYNKLDINYDRDNNANSKGSIVIEIRLLNSKGSIVKISKKF